MAAGLWLALDHTARTSAGKVGDAVEARVAGGVGEIVLVGNSISGKALDGDALGARLGVTVTDLAVDGTLPAHWYAVLKSYVFGRGARPRLVVLYANPGAMTTTRLEEDAQQAAFAMLEGADDPVVASRAFPDGASLAAIRARAGARYVLRDAVTDLVVHGAVGVGEPRGRDGLLSAGRERLRRAEAVVFGVMPEDRKPKPAAATGPAPEPVKVSESLLPALAELCEAHGARLVLAFAATHPKQRRKCGDPGTLQPGFGDLAAGGPVDLLRLDTLDVPARMFADSFHLRGRGEALVTEATAIAMLRSGVARAAPTAPGTSWSWPCEDPPAIEVAEGDTGVARKKPKPRR
ncbi:MAG: hypothetical protein ACOZNI_16200 [Myxococcota bacterium]